MTDIEGPKSRIDFCPHCGNRTPQQLVAVRYFDTTAWHVSESSYKEHGGYVGASYVACCSTCSRVLVYEDFNVDRSALSFERADLSYPEPAELHEAVPETVAGIYEEAALIASIAPNAYAVMIRRALEALCDDRGSRPGTLHSRLEELASRGELPALLASLTHTLRTLGNQGAHFSETSLSQPDVWAIRDFFRAVVEYVYIAPYKLIAFKKRLGDNL